MNMRVYNIITFVKGGLYCAQITKNAVDLIQLSIHSETNEFVQRHVKYLNLENSTNIDLINLEVASITDGNSFIQLQPLFDEKNSEQHRYNLDEVITDQDILLQVPFYFLQ